jgi:hypothetical protein
MRTLMTTIGLSLCLLPLLPTPARAAVVYVGPSEAPPPPRSEVVRTRHGYVWVGGHYGWRHHRYYWSRGHYVRERRGWVWRDGEWGHRERAYEWHPGRWEPAR